MAPRLSICVPSRNRQFYFQQTILALIQNPRPDVEFVFVDNSDDASVMAGFMAQMPEDTRVRFLPSGKKIFSMVDNWERAVAASSGDWITIIGDDDYLDPDLATLLARMDNAKVKCDALNWRNFAYYWPGPMVERGNIPITLNSDIVRIPQTRLFRRLFLWEDSTCVPSVGYSIYHSAISRALMEKIRKRFGGRYFEHPTVDFENAFKVTLSGAHFIYTSRPFSIHGRCPVSCSGAMISLDAVKKKNAEFMEDLGRDLKDETDPQVPLPYHLGVTASILQTMLWLSRVYRFKVEGWQENFAKACGDNCYLYKDEEQFERMAQGYRTALSQWAGGRYLKYFDPVFSPPTIGPAFCGTHDQTVYLLDNEATFSTPTELYSIISGMFESPDDMPLDSLGTDQEGALPVSPLLNVILERPPPKSASPARRAAHAG